MIKLFNNGSELMEDNSNRSCYNLTILMGVHLVMDANAFISTLLPDQLFLFKLFRSDWLHLGSLFVVMVDTLFPSPINLIITEVSTFNYLFSCPVLLLRVTNQTALVNFDEPAESACKIAIDIASFQPLDYRKESRIAPIALSHTVLAPISQNCS